MTPPSKDDIPKKPKPTRFKLVAAGAAATLGTFGTWLLRSDTDQPIDLRMPPANITSSATPPPQPRAGDPPKDPPQAVDMGDRKERTPASLLDDPPYDPKFDRALFSLCVADERRYLDCLHARPSTDGKHITLYIDLAALGVPEVYPKDPHAQNQSFVFPVSSYIDLELPDTLVRDERKNTKKCLCINLAEPGITAAQAEERIRSLSQLMARYPDFDNTDAMESWMYQAAALMDKHPPAARKNDTYSPEMGMQLDVELPGSEKWIKRDFIRVDCYTQKDINKTPGRGSPGKTDRHR